jgi:ABC-type spermidine/putrescine transport system permease subunit I
MLAVTLRLPRLRPLIEGLSLLPLVIPPIALVAGLRDMLALGPDQLAGTPFGDFLASSQDPDLPAILIIVYVVLAISFAYRSLDAGIRSIDARTMVDVARGLDASWPAVVLRVLLPNLRGAVLGAAFLTLGLVLGEYTPVVLDVADAHLGNPVLDRAVRHRCSPRRPSYRSSGRPGSSVARTTTPPPGTRTASWWVPVSRSVPARSSPTSASAWLSRNR